MKIPFVSAAVLVSSVPVHAGGLMLPVRGVRTLERAGAFIAGADDADALWLDPAGLAHIHGSGAKALLFDVAYVYQPVDHAPVDGSGVAPSPVRNLQPGRTPIPTIAAAFGVDDNLTIAGGLTAPYAGLHRYPADAAQRHGSISLAEASFALVTLGAAYRISDSLRIGATLQNLVSSIRSEIMVSACPGTMMCAPDDRTFDSLMTIEQTDYVSLTGSIGVQFDAARSWTLGLALQGPARVASSGTLTLSLPSSSVFDDALVTGDQGSLAFTLPPIVRAGLEYRPSASLRIEAALGVELWSMHDAITIEPDDIRIENAQGINAYPMNTMTIPRDYTTSFAPALGVEYHGGSAMIGAGVSYETAAAPASHVSVLAVDAAKLLVGVGGGYASDGWQLGGAVGYVKVEDVDVPLGTARVPQLQPFRDQPAAVFVNAGTYQTSYLVVGLRAARRF